LFIADIDFIVIGYVGGGAHFKKLQSKLKELNGACQGGNRQ